jgi:antitoxin ChpS
MAVVSVRRQGGAAIMTIPAEVVKDLGIAIGAELDVSVADGVLTARPRKSLNRKRYTLDDLLAGVTPASMRALADDTARARDGAPIGREL